MATSTMWLEASFQAAKDDFLGSLTNKAVLDLSKIVTVEDVYQAARDIEKQQAKTKTYRGLKRIEPLIKVLEEYSGVVDTFAQVKPDVLCLIWGGLKFLLQAASALTAVFEKIVKVLGEIGRFLPSFQQYATLFPQNDDIRRVLCLFFEDILSVYAVLLNFSTDKRLKVILEPFWPNIRTKIDKIQENIEHHKALLTVNVTLEDISRAHKARKLALEEYDRAQESRNRQAFLAVRNEIRPKTYHSTKADIIQRTSEGSGKWLEKKEDFMRWLDPVDRTLRCLWLCGIPGAGKTYLAGSIIHRMESAGQCVLYVFISHEDQSAGKTINFLHSLLFQALEEIPSLQLILSDSFDSNHKNLVRDRGFVLDLLCKVLTAIGPTFIVIDGLDEIEEDDWKDIVLTIIQVQNRCAETKALISSREVRGIGLVLEKHATTLRMEKNNLADIQEFVKIESQDLLVEIESYGASKNVCSGIRTALKSIAKRSDGMFLYAKLVLHVVKDHRTLPEIQSEVENLPNGLDQAYGRLISRIEGKMSPKLRTVVHKALMWIACAERPLREEQMLQALAVDVGTDDFTRGPKEYRDIRQTCGPIIEVYNGTLRFVHFSAKEYLLHDQSNNFLNLADAQLNAALTCVTYLSYASLDVLFPASGGKTGIEDQILNGEFVLLEYAALHYMDHIKAYAKIQSCQQPNDMLSFVVNRLFVTRANAFFDNQSEPLESVMSQLSIFQRNSNMHRSLGSAASFITAVRSGVITTNETTSSSAKDPLTIFSALAEFRRHVEDMACDEQDHSAECSCRALKQFYGEHLYHCDKAFCNAFVSGFRGQQSREQHIFMHSLPFKCSVLDCIFSDTGFRSNAELSRHMSSAHARSDLLMASGSRRIMLPEPDMLLAIQDAIVNDQLDVVQRLVPDYLSSRPEDGGDIVQLAASISSVDLLKWLKDACHFVNDDDVLGAAIEGENIPNIKFLHSLGADFKKSSFLYRSDKWPKWNSSASLNIIRALRRWNGDLMRVLIVECGVILPQQWNLGASSPAEIFEAQHLSDATLEDVRRKFATVKPFVLWPEAYARGAYHAVGTRSPSVVRVCLENGCDPNQGPNGYTPLHGSVPGRGGEDLGTDITKMLLEHGADPNTRNGHRKKWTALHEAAIFGHVNHARLLLKHKADVNAGESPLHAAVRYGKADMVKLLLEHGASTDTNGKNPLEHLKAMEKIEKYFGAPWKEIVRRFQPQNDIRGGL